MVFSFNYLIITLITLCFTSVICESERRWGPWVSPKVLEEISNRSFMTFNCSADLKPKQILAWYQIRKTEAEPTLLAITQQYSSTQERNTITLFKTLELSDNGTQIYCAVQKVLSEGKFGDVEKSENITILFHGSVQKLEEPRIHLEPSNKTAYFDVNTTLHFNCTGTKPVDGRSYKWFLKNTESKLTLPLDQKYDLETNINHLKLLVNESHHGCQLFCAQEFHLYIKQTDDTHRRKKYGELVRSELITLVQRGREVSTFTTHHILALVLPVLLVAIAAVIVIVAVLWARRRRLGDASLDAALVKEEKEDIYDSNYATARVTYAVLDLEHPDTELYATPAHAPIRPAMNYVQIIGVLKPKADTR